MNKKITKEEKDKSEDLKFIDEIINEHSEKIHTYYCGNRADKIRSIISHYNNLANNTLLNIKAFREDLLVWMRAIAMIAEMIGNGATHAEKGARIRGLIEFLETCIEKVRKMEIDFSFGYWSFPDIWRSDYPVRDILRQNFELKRELETLKNDRNRAED